MRKLRTHYSRFCGRPLYIDILLFLMIVVVFGGGGLAACSSDAAPSKIEKPAVIATRYDLKLENGYELGAVYTFKLKGYCYTAIDIARGAGLGSGLTRVRCEGR